MLTILLATDDSSRQPTRHLCSFPPPLRLKILNIMCHFWLVRGDCNTEELNFAAILFSFLPFTLPSLSPLSFCCSSSWNNAKPSMNGLMDLTFGAGNVQFVSAGADNNQRVLDVKMGLLVSENNCCHSGQHNFPPANGLILLSHRSYSPHSHRRKV